MIHLEENLLILVKILAAIVFNENYMNSNHEKELREYIAGKLPSYMIPSIFMFLDENDIPRTSNGKADRRQLVKLIDYERDK